jgi:hypothetical protein
MQCAPEAFTNLTDLSHSLHLIGRRRDDKLLAEAFKKMTDSVDKTAKQVHKTTQNVDKLWGWASHMDDSLEDDLTMSVCEEINGVRIADLELIVDGTGIHYVEFDGVVRGQTKAGVPVLVLVEAKHCVRDTDFDIERCRSDETRHDCLPTRVERFIDAYNGLLDTWKSEQRQGSKILNKLKLQSDIINGLKKDDVQIVAAIGGRLFPESLQKHCKKKKYWPLIPNGRAFEVHVGM